MPAGKIMYAMLVLLLSQFQQAPIPVADDLVSFNFSSFPLAPTIEFMLLV